MNIERLTIIAEWLEAGAPHKGNVVGFNMADWLQNDGCSTTCCIGGAAIEFFGDTRASLSTQAAELLGLDWATADELFYVYDEGEEESILPLHLITPAHAARCIRNLIATGEVDWRNTRE